MASSLQCNDQARPLKRKNEKLADDDDDETTRQTKQARRDGHSEAHSSQQEESLSSNTTPSSPQKRANVPQEIWDLIVQYLENISEKKWSCELHNNLDDSYLDLDGRERRLVTKTLYNLTLTGRIPYQSAIKALYHSIFLRGTKSAVLLFRTLKRRSNDRFPNDTLFCYNIRDFIRELIILGPLAEYKCCKVLAVQEWPDKASSDSTIHKAIKRWESWKGLRLQRHDKDSLEPIVAAAMMAELFRMSPQLHTLAIKDDFIPRRSAYDSLDMALSEMDRKKKKDNDENKAHVFPNLSTFVMLGASGDNQTDWTPLIQRHSTYGIKNLHLKRLDRSIKVPSSVEHIQLSHEPNGALDLSTVMGVLSSFEISFGAKEVDYPHVPYYLSALPTSLTSLRVDSGYLASYRTIRLFFKPSMFPQLTSLQMPMVFLFGIPSAMGEVTADFFPSSLVWMELLEVWLEDSCCGDNYDDYGDKMATFLLTVLKNLPHLKLLKFREQWKHWRYSLANQRKRFPIKVQIAPLFPETSSVLCQRASAYMRESTLTALNLVSKATALEPRNLRALLLKAKIEVTLGLAEEAAKTIASMDSPVHPLIKDPIERMLGHLDTAREYWREDPARAMLALDQLVEGRLEDNQPREWRLMRANAYLLLPSKEPSNIADALEIAFQLISINKHDVDALFLAGQAFYELERYDEAVMYLQQANCCDPERSDIVKWLEDAEAQQGVV